MDLKNIKKQNNKFLFFLKVGWIVGWIISDLTGFK